MRRESLGITLALAGLVAAAGVALFAGFAYAVGASPSGTGLWWSFQGVQQPATIPLGDAGTVLTSNGPDAAPTWGPNGSNTGALGNDLTGPTDGGVDLVLQITGDGGTNAYGGQGTIPVLAHMMTGAFGSDYPVDWETTPITINNSTSWYAALIYTPSLTSDDDITLRFCAHDRSELSDGGVNTDASAAVDAGSSGPANFACFTLKLHAMTLPYLPDGGLGTTIYLCAQGAVPCNVTPGSVLSIATLAIDDQHGCTTLNSFTGCVANGTTSFAAQAVYDGGQVTVQINAGSNTATWPWIGEGRGIVAHRISP